MMSQKWSVDAASVRAYPRIQDGHADGVTALQQRIDRSSRRAASRTTRHRASQIAVCLLQHRQVLRRGVELTRHTSTFLMRLGTGMSERGSRRAARALTVRDHRSTRPPHGRAMARQALSFLPSRTAFTDRRAVFLAQFGHPPSARSDPRTTGWLGTCLQNRRPARSYLQNRPGRAKPRGL